MAVPQNCEELQALQNFRPIVHDLGFPDGVLMRFLRARSLDPVKSEDMIRKFVVWRVEAECNKFRDWEIPVKLFTYDAYFTGFDYEGRPVFWAPFGHWPYVRTLLDEGREADILRYAGMLMDRVHNLLLATKHQQFIAIVDSDGITFTKVFYEARNWKGFTTLMGLLRDYEANFPELLNQAFMVNTPLAFMWGWKFLQGCFTDYTLSKVHFFGTERQKWKDELFKALPASAIPPIYGGTANLIQVTPDSIGPNLVNNSNQTQNQAQAHAHAKQPLRIEDCTGIETETKFQNREIHTSSGAKQIARHK